MILDEEQFRAASSILAPISTKVIVETHEVTPELLNEFEAPFRQVGRMVYNRRLDLAREAETAGAESAASTHSVGAAAGGGGGGGSHLASVSSTTPDASAAAVATSLSSTIPGAPAATEVVSAPASSSVSTASVDIPSASASTPVPPPAAGGAGTGAGAGAGAGESGTNLGETPTSSLKKAPEGQVKGNEAAPETPEEKAKRIIRELNISAAVVGGAIFGTIAGLAINEAVVGYGPITQFGELSQAIKLDVFPTNLENGYLMLFATTAVALILGTLIYGGIKTYCSKSIGNEVLNSKTAIKGLQ